MVDSRADVTLSSTVESGLQDDVEALFKGMNSQRGSHKGMLTWSLQKKVEADPSCGVSLIRVLVEKLEKKSERVSKVCKTRSYTPIIPVLHTLYYVIIQSGAIIPHSLYQRVYECLGKLLILPLPYSAVALRILRSMRMEMTTPGSLYQRRVIAEQNLKNEHFTVQEKVFVLADPAVFAAPLEATVRAYLEVSSFLKSTQSMERNVLLHVLQTGLEMKCPRSKLAQALETLDDQTVKKYFQELVGAVKLSLSLGTGGHTDYLNNLQHIYSDIMVASEEEMTEVDRGCVCSTTMPFPEINFLLWKDEEDLWNLLANFALPSGSNSSMDEEEQGKRDSGIEKDLKEGDIQSEQTPVKNRAFTRRNAYRTAKSMDKLKLMNDRIEEVPGSSPGVKEERSHTARVVVMGDDRVLGRLTRAYHSIREKESRHIILNKKLNVQLYYVPVSHVEPSLSSSESPYQNEDRLSLASYLGKVDPWYNSNINNLGAAIPKLPEMISIMSEPSELNLYLLDTLCYYLRCGTQPVNLPLYSVKMIRSDASSMVEEVFVSHLEANIPEFRHLKDKLLKKNPGSRKKSTVELFGAVISVSYTKTSLSKREVVKGEAPMTCGVVITSEPAASTSDEDYLAVHFDSVNPGNNTKIQTQNISLKTLENRTLSVCLDKDSRRTYTNVRRIEISRCLDPGCNIQPTNLLRGSSRSLLPLSKFVGKVLSLPINTFTGVTV